MNIRAFILLLMGGLVVLGCKDSVDPFECEPVDTEIKHKPKLIMNNDGGDAYGRNVPESEEEFLDFRLNAMTKHADYVFYSTGTSHKFTHASNHGERISGDFISYLKGKKTDPLKVAADFVHSRGKKIFFSFRMNDTHDSSNERLFPDWKVENNAAVAGFEGREYASGGQRWSAMDYEYDVTREYVYNVIEEVVLNYEVDGVELDFFRHPIFFGSQLDGELASQYQLDIMTGLIERISNLCSLHGKKLAIRVPDSISYNEAIGIDLQAWLNQGLVDIVSLSGYFHLSQWCAIAAIKDWGNFELFACLSKSRLKNSKTGKILPDYYWSNEAARALQNGFDGIYLFNVYRKDSAKYSLFNIENLNNSYDPEYQEQKGNDAGYWVRNGINYYNF